MRAYIALQKHAKPYSAATHNELGVVLWHRWGKVAICNKKVMEWALCLLTITGVTTACLFNPYDFHTGHPVPQPDTTTALFIRTSCTMSVTQRYLSMGPHVTTRYGLLTWVKPGPSPHR